MSATNLFYSQSTVVYIWGTIDVIRYKYQILMCGIGELLLVIPIWILWSLLLIPSVRSLWQYSAIYYIVFIPIWIVNLFMSDSRSKELFLFAWVANSFVFAVTSFVFYLISTNIVGCWKGEYEISCRDTMLADVIVWWFTFFLWIVTLLIFIAYFSIITRIRQSNSINAIKYKNLDDLGE